MIIVGAGHDNGVNDPLVLAASILATAINGAQRQQQQVSPVKNIYKKHLYFQIHKNSYISTRRINVKTDIIYRIKHLVAHVQRL